MDLNAVTFGVGFDLTNSALEAGFADITGHAITRADFATGYSWGVDIDLDGFGITGLRQINGNIVFAAQFGTGDDASAVQSAVNFVNSSSPGQGIVILTPLAGGAAWGWDATVTLYDGITILGWGGPTLNKTSTTDMFELGASGVGADDVTIDGLVVDGNATAGGFVAGADSDRLTIRNCYFGVGTANSAYFTGSVANLTSTGATGNRDIVIRNCHVVEGNGLADIQGAVRCQILDNVVFGTRQFTASTHTINIASGSSVTSQDLTVSGNYLWGTSSSGTSGGPLGAIKIANATNVVIRDNFCFGGGAGHLCQISGSIVVRLMDNVFLDAGSNATTNLYDCINVAATTEIWIERNVASHTPTSLGGSTAQPRYGINVPSGNSGVYIFDNFLENIDDAPATGSHWMCGTAGIAVGTTTRVMRFNNRIIMSQYRMDCPYVSSAGAPKYEFTCNGIRAAASDQARHDQVVGVMVSLNYNSGGGANPPTLAWNSDPLGTGASKFSANNKIDVTASTSPSAFALSVIVVA